MLTFMRLLRYCTVAVLLATIAAPVRARQVTAPAAGDASFIVFRGGAPIGREQVRLTRAATGWTITVTGQTGAPVGLVIDEFELKYTADWQPIELKLAATVRGRAQSLNTSFGLTTAISEIRQGDSPASKTDQITARSIVLPNGVFGAYEALAARLSTAAQGAQFRVYVAPQAEISVEVTGVAEERVQTPAATLRLRKFSLSFENPGAPLPVNVWVDDHARLARVQIPAASLDVLRDDISSVSARQERVPRPGDETVNIPASGFTLAGTISKPAGTQARPPAIVLIAGSGAQDRDEVAFGIPVFGQLAASLADAGFLVLRYDKRGTGQSGGRIESATLRDYAEDARAAVRFLRKRKDVDSRRIALAGHSEGGSVALLVGAATGDVSALVLIATMSGTGAELILEQQRHLLDQSRDSEAERQVKIELQKKIQAAVITGSGWEGIPEQLREQADSPWFRSFLMFDTAKTFEKVKQPLLIVQGTLDTQVPQPHAHRLAELARARRQNRGAELVTLEGINHLLVPAVTGEVAEYASLPDKTVSPKVAAAINAWLSTVFQR
jgi:pimeloyl-ACP methyl ester carboxylesterase